MHNVGIDKVSRPVTSINSLRISKAPSKRDSSVNQSLTMKTSEDLKHQTGSAKEKSHLTIKTRSKSRKQAGKGSTGGKWLHKETLNAGIRVRKVFMPQKAMKDSMGGSLVS